MNRSIGGNKRRRLIFLRTFEIVMLVLSAIYIYPLIFALISSFKDKVRIYNPLLLPNSLYLDNFKSAFGQGEYLQLLLNSVIVSAISLVIVIIIGSMAAYPLSRKQDKLYTYLYLFFVSGLMIPFQSGIVPLFQLVRKLGLMNSLGSLILINIGTLMPMTILIFAGFIKTVPRELDEAAMIDGCGYFGRFFRIVFPLIRPAMATVFILDLLPVWNDFMSPLLFITNKSRMTLPVGIFAFMTERVRDYGSIYAISILSLIPPVIFFILLQRYFYSGITAGSLKG